EALRRILGPLGGELRRLRPELAAEVPGLPEPLAGDENTERYRLFNAVAGWLSALSEDAPVVVLIDDLQWATMPTVLLLRHLLRRRDAAPPHRVGRDLPRGRTRSLRRFDPRPRCPRRSPRARPPALVAPLGRRRPGAVVRLRRGHGVRRAGCRRHGRPARGGPSHRATGGGGRGPGAAR